MFLISMFLAEMFDNEIWNLSKPKAAFQHRRLCISFKNVKRYKQSRKGQKYKNFLLYKSKSRSKIELLFVLINECYHFAG